MRAIRRAGVAAGLLLALGAVPVHASTVTIDFDSDPDGQAVADGADVGSLYSRLGVTFARSEGLFPETLCNDGGIFARSGDPFASAPNVVSICAPGSFPSFNNQQAYVRGTLDRDAVEICIAVNPEGSVDRGILEIVDAQDTVLDSVGSAEGVQQTICIQGAQIRFFRFAGNGRFATFDDLRITYGPNRIDFDETADGTPIADGAIVDDLFESEGVRFEYAGGGTGCGGGFVYANDDLPGTFGTPPNGVSVCNGAFSDFSENTNGRVRAVFVRAIGEVCVDVQPSSGSGRAVLRGFDADGFQVVQTLSAVGAEERICVLDSRVRFVEFAGYQGTPARFDNLDFDLGSASIDFDFDPTQAPIGSGVVNSAYQSVGVTFTGLRVGGQACGAGTDVYANGDTTGDFSSSPNQVSLCDSGFSDFSSSGDGQIQASFTIDASQVCIEVRASRADDFAELVAFGSGGQEIASSESSSGSTETLCVAASGIRSVRFGGAGSRFARFDDLDVTFSPEPGAALLGLAALATAAGLRSVRRRAPARPAPRRT